MAGAVPTTMNPTYREPRSALPDGSVGRGGPDQRRATAGGHRPFRPCRRCERSTRSAPPAPEDREPFSNLYGHAGRERSAQPEHDSRLTLATLPFSSGTTGLPKGVMLSHHNIVANVYQTLTARRERAALSERDSVLCFLPLYHIYGLTVGLNMALDPRLHGGTDAAIRLRSEPANRSRRRRHGQPVRATGTAGVLPRGRRGQVPREPQDPLGEVRRCAACARSGSPIH